MDWNWFFSAMAQSTAAIVGLFAAFIITKIINNQTEFARKKDQISELCNEALRYIESADNRYFNWYNERRMATGLNHVREMIIKDTDQLTAEEYYSEIYFPIYEKKDEVLKQIQSVKDDFPALHEGAWTSIDLGVELTNKLVKEEDDINRLITEINHHIRRINSTLLSIKGNPESSGLIAISIGSVILLFFSGVIYPLSFLPLKADAEITLSFTAFWDILLSTKGIMLLIVSIIFSGITTVFLKINSTLTYDETDIENLRLYSNISSYSDFFKIMEENAKQD